MLYPLSQSHDGRHAQAQVLLALMRNILTDGAIEESWDEQTKSYLAIPFVNHWDLPKTRGYIVSLASEQNGTQINVAIMGAPSSDHYQIIWCRSSFKAWVTASDFPEVGPSDFFRILRAPGEVYRAAEFAVKLLKDFWKENSGCP